ncbi:PilE-like protein [Elusimicrobium minutum Pei191]|uniref:PilE-like protein n=1 Tax=Elusimicrobium minutum (strain Pei191) TaxID=445932 RepID=B2KCB0_ELUMP|nr:prepilin-type N-terminal cleavage/methylation domain-containing protein [Elusimicrobium minutum]ACC98237.1 PilE-like protein [Elusimicrobium minutum Pei191]
MQNKLFKKNSFGFTLIELLVVVLIIGILAAIAVPQYQKAVFKSRFATLYAAVNAIAQAEEIYYMETGTYTQDKDALVINMDESSKDLVNIWNNPSTDNWAVHASLDSGTLTYLVWPANSKVRNSARLCRAYLNKPNTELAKSVCVSLMDKSTTVVKAAEYWEYFL